MDNPFDHNNSRYERPLQAFRCGRSRRWQTACWQGPDASGNCQGRSECNPVRQGDKYLCRRPAHAGGPCESGPLPDGSCACQHPPCVPQPTLRRRRGRYVALAAALAVLVLAAFANFHSPALESMPLAMDAGAISQVHQKFVGERGCAGCHSLGGQTTTSLLTALLKEDNLSEACVGCHDFGGRAMVAHNLPKAQGAAEPVAAAMTDQARPCTACHQEHQGTAGTLPAMTNLQCGSTCHAERFTDLAHHPAFPPAFPHDMPGTIRFDHDKHFKRHFPQYFRGKGDQELADARRCTSCHQVQQATREVRPAGYQVACGRCHDNDLRGREVAMLASDEPAALGALLLSVAPDDETAFSEQREDFLTELAGDGVDYLDGALQEQGVGKDLAAAALAPFEDFAIDEVADAWLADSDGFERQHSAGLAADEESLRYRIRGHGDPVAAAWIEIAVKHRAALRAAGDAPEAVQAATQAIAAFANDDTGAACGKCHAVGQRNGAGGVIWRHRGNEPRLLSRYSHAPHINLLGPDKSCLECHRIDAKADYGTFFDALGLQDAPRDNPYHSNFQSIEPALCSNCHNGTGVSDNCTQCHTYHPNTTTTVGRGIAWQHPTEGEQQ